MFLKLLSFVLGFVFISFIPMLKLYNDILLNPQDQIILTPKQYPKIEISLNNEFRVPHIYSDTLQGTLYGLGFMHAKDRLWQIQIKRLVAYGRLAEYFGEDVLFIDKYFRTLGLLEVCQKNWEIMQQKEPETAANIIAYTAGINAFMKEERAKMMPMEFVLLGVPWTEWTPMDCLMLVKFAFVNLIVDWQAELLRSKLGEHFTPEIIEEIFPGRSIFHYDFADSINDEELKQSGLYKENIYNASEKPYYIKKNDTKRQTSKPKEKGTHYLSSLYEILSPGPSFFKGSNTWVVHGNHTKSGKPILAGDPHLDNNIPSIWYLAELKYLSDSKEQYIIGASMTGIPYIVFGRSQYLVWSGAIAIGDNSDAFVEVLNENRTKYFFNGEYHDLIIKEEDIKVRGSEPYHLTIRKTRHGPILNYFLTDVAMKEMWLDRDYSFAWPGFKDEDESYTSFYNLYKINSWEPSYQNMQIIVYKFKEQIVGAFANLTFTSICANIATNDGHIIGVITSAFLKKKNTSPVKDYFPKDGTDPENEWLGLIDPTEKPFIIDPPKGFIFQANNKLVGDGYKYETASNYITTARGSRIKQLLEEYIARGEKIGVEEMMKMQQDTVDIYAKDMLPKMITIVNKLKQKFTMEEQKVLDYFIRRIKNWDARHEVDQVETSLFGIQFSDYYQKYQLDVWQYLFRAHFLLFFENEEDSIALQHIYQFEQFLMFEITKWSKNVQKICKLLNKNKLIIKVDNKADPTYDICPQLHFSQITNQQHLKLVSEHCAYLLPIALLMTKDYLTKELGTDISKWTWGNLHQNRYIHIPFSEVPVLREIFERRRPGQGNINTINCGIPKFKGKTFESYHGPNFRMISEMPGDLYQVIDTGENENVFSENYFDQAELFSKGEYIKMEFGKFDKKQI